MASPFQSIRKRFELVPGKHRPKPARIGIIFLLIVLGLTAFAASGKVPFLPDQAQLPFLPSGREFKAEFPDADYIDSATPVRVAGVDVGMVEKVERQPGGDGALVTFSITDDTIDIHEDAHANLFAKNLLGFSYELELFPGSPGSPVVAEGATIPEEVNSSPVDISQAVLPLDEFGRAAVRGFFKEVATGLDTRSAGATIDELGPAMETVGPGISSLRGERPGDLTRLVDRAGQALDAVGRQEDALAGLIGNGATTVAAIEAQRESLGTTIADGPETMAETQTTMVRLRTTLDKLDPTVDALRPGARRLDEAATVASAALREADPLLEDLRPTLARLEPAARELRGAARDGVPLMNELQPTIDRTNQSILPWLDETDADSKLKNYAAVLPFFANVDSIAAEYDSQGHRVHFGTGLSAETVPPFGYLPCEAAFSQTDQNPGEPSGEDGGIDELVVCQGFNADLRRAFELSPGQRDPTDESGAASAGEANGRSEPVSPEAKGFVPETQPQSPSRTASADDGGTVGRMVDETIGSLEQMMGGGRS